MSTINKGDRVVTGVVQPPHFAGREGVVTAVAPSAGDAAFTHRVLLLEGPSAWFRESELTLLEETAVDAPEPEPAPQDAGPTVIVLRYDPSYLIDLRQFGDGDHSQILLTQAETDRLIGALIAAVDG